MLEHNIAMYTKQFQNSNIIFVKKRAYNWKIVLISIQNNCFYVLPVLKVPYMQDKLLF